MSEHFPSIRIAEPSDLESILDCFEASIRGTCTRHYTSEQIEKWLQGKFNTVRWLDAIKQQYFLVANNKSDSVAGFASLTTQGEIDFMYLRPEVQGKGLASELITRITAKASASQLSRLTTYASLTATPFFEQHGFHLVRSNKVEIEGVSLMNNYMEKSNINTN